ncbi:Translation initiation factor 3 N-terminal domain-containing protein [Plasmodiophora brassicae]|nr:hypothetical protein PBRA_007110 [Plasmodiophora brassicae]
MRRLASVADDPVVLLIDKAGKNLGHKTMSEAVRLAAHSHGDLFPVNTSKQPAVYKIGLASAKPAEQPLAPAGAAEAKTSKTCKKVKEKCVQFTTRTEKHDFDHKVASARKFLLEGHRVSIVVTLINKGARVDKGNRVLTSMTLQDARDRICNDLADVGKLHGSVRDIGWRHTFALNPLHPPPPK